MSRHKQPAVRFKWEVRYPDSENSTFAKFTWEKDAEAFVTLMKLIDNREYEIVQVEHE